MPNADDITARMPPQALDAEMAVLGSLMMESQAASTTFEILDEGCFYKEANRKIFLASLALYERNEPIDILTVSNQLEKRKELEAVGGQYYLTELVERIPSAANVEYYCKIVLDRSLLRRLISVSSDVQQECYSTTEDAFDLIDRAEQKIFALSEKRQRRSFSHIGPVLHQTVETIETFHHKAGGVTGVPTGFKELDDLLSGLQPSELIIIAGRPSMGKTAFALNIARNAAVKESAVGIFSLEMASYQLAMRMLCSEAHVDSHRLRTGKLAESDLMRLSMSVGRLAEAPIYIDDTPGMSILEIRSKARRLKVEHKIGLVIIDYLQLIHGSSRAESRQIEIAMISQSLKALAKELDIPVVALSQLSRAVESRGGERRPILSDLRESGAIEQDADVVMFMYRPSVYSPLDSSQENLAEVIIAKQRNGPTGTAELVFKKEYVTFLNKEAFREELPVVAPNLF
jgi:replicative DNA helicase